MGIANFAIHMAYSTFPNGKEKEFIQTKRKTFDKYIKDNNECLIDGKVQEDVAYYKPLIFHLFGSFDVVFISLIDNYKFCQKVFDIDASKYGVSTNYQILTGYYDDNYFPRNSEEYLKKYFPANNTSKQKLSEYKFVHITNFKLNNGLLIGNGNNYIDVVLRYLHESLEEEKSDYLLIRSFNWSEITLIQFGNSLEVLQERIIRYRELSINELNANDSTILENSLYYSLFFNSEKNSEINQIQNSHVFVDTHSYSGVDYYEFNGKYSLKKNPYQEDRFKSSIELQVKPGHLNALHDVLEKDNSFDESRLKFKNGKTDYLVKETGHESFISNYQINQRYRHDNDRNIAKHVRKLKTNFLFDLYDNISGNANTLFKNQVFGKVKEVDERNGENKFENIGITNFTKVLAEDHTIEIKGLKKNLKKLGISRQLREKILKAFYNFNNLIQDIILYGEFIELKAFLLFLKDDINGEVKNLQDFFNKPVEVTTKTIYNKHAFSVRTIEKKWKRILDIFEEAYQNKVHNNYLYEDFNEFSIDFNSAVNQVNIVHDFIVKTINNFFFPQFKDQIIVTQNGIDTKSNVLNVNYNVYHFLEPSLIFTTLFKEIINGLEERAGIVKEDENEKEHFEKVFSKDYFKILRDEIFLDIEGDLSSEQKVHFKNFDLLYFFADITKLGLTFLFDYDLYEYWTWTYFLQGSDHYQKSGLPDEGMFNKELLRISIIKSCFVNNSYIKWPVPELFDIWQESINGINDLAKKITANNHFKEALNNFSEYVFIRQLKIEDENTSNLSSNLLRRIDEADQKEYSETHRRITRRLDKCFTANDEYNNDPFNQLESIYLASKIIKRTIDKGEIEEVIEEVFNSKQGALYLICAISYHVLSRFKEKGGELKLLRRDWTKGLPLSEFSNIETESVFIDPFGGFFYNSLQSKREYFKLKNSVLHILWHFAIVDKKRLFTSKK